MSDPASTEARPYLSVVIPAYNEETRLPETIRTVESFLAGWGKTWELIVVDDGSKDGTIAAANAAITQPHSRVVASPRNQGKGAAVQRGMLAAKGEYRLFSDADLSTPITELDNLMAAMQREGASVAIGSRALKDSKLEVRQPIYREAMGRFFNVIVQTVALGGIRDTQCGFKLFSAKAADDIFPKQQFMGFSFDVELLVLARKFGHKIAEVPVRWIDSPASRVSPITDSAKMFIDVVKIRMRS